MSEVHNHLQPGTMLRGDTYRIVRFIAAGGFGCTYEAEHVLLEKRVAIKEFFMQDYCNREDYTNRVTVGTKSKFELVDKYKRKFIGEAKALSGLEHEGIVRVSDVFEENGTAYFVMDYVDGQSLAGLCKNGPLPEKHALYYIRQVCEALAYVHDHNRLHLDLKPGNIMVKADGRTVLIDFGASKQYDAASGENNTSLLGYTPGYAPLEQMRGDVKQFLPATDIYALGATLYCLLTGKAPNNEEDDLVFPAGISAATRHAVERAMEFRKKDRPQSVREFVALLDAAVKPVSEFAPVAVPESQAVPAPAPVPPAAVSTTETIISGDRPKKSNIWAPLFLAVSIVVSIALISLSAKGCSTSEGDDRTSVFAESPATGTHEGHEWVDLGLSVKWATCNVGAPSPEDYGNYYAWGETSTKSEYTEGDSDTYERNMIDIRGNSGYDAARANWGGSWRMPTEAECDELVNNCDRQWTTQNGVKGMRFTSKKNGNSVFFPAAGLRNGTSTDFAGENGYYWSSSLSEGYTQSVYTLYFDSGGCISTYWSSRYDGHPVRPVVE